MEHLDSVIWALGTLFLLQLLGFGFLALSFRLLRKEMSDLLKETHGCVKKIEGLTSSRRELMQKQYEKILAELTARLPVTIASHASQSILETEKKILARLAELEPILDTSGQKKMEDLIRSMEDLEHTIVSLTAESVRKVLLDSRGEFLNEDERLAA
jgi:hypothetical protein